MNRVIKFRVWCKQNEVMKSVARIGFIENELWYVEDEDHETQPPYFYDVDDWVLMQYTGFKDKNGKEIYEGDIVKYIDRNLSNAFGGQGDPWETKIMTIKWFRSGWIIPMGFVKEIEVIGNVYENPELLEGGKYE